MDVFSLDLEQDSQLVVSTWGVSDEFLSHLRLKETLQDEGPSDPDANFQGLNDPGHDETGSSSENQVSVPDSQQDSLASRIADTQYASVEINTQTTDAFDHNLNRKQNERGDDIRPQTYQNHEKSHSSRELLSPKGSSFNPYKLNRAPKINPSNLIHPGQAHGNASSSQPNNIEDDQIDKPNENLGQAQNAPADNPPVKQPETISELSHEQSGLNDLRPQDVSTDIDQVVAARSGQRPSLKDYHLSPTLENQENEAISCDTGPPLPEDSHYAGLIDKTIYEEPSLRKKPSESLTRENTKIMMAPFPEVSVNSVASPVEVDVPPVNVSRQPSPKGITNLPKIGDEGPSHVHRASRVEKSRRAKDHRRSRGEGKATTMDMVALLQQMAQHEHEQLQSTKTKAEEQESVIEELSEENRCLKSELETAQRKIVGFRNKLKEFEARGLRYKTHVNTVIDDQKFLYEKAAELKTAYKELADELSREKVERAFALKRLDKVRELFSSDGRMRKTWQEASIELTNQSKTIEILKQDLDKGLSDLQRERKINDDLQREQKENGTSMRELRTMLVDQRESLGTLITEHQEKISSALTFTEASEKKLDDCLEKVQSTNERGQVVMSRLKDLLDLGNALASSVDRRFQTAEGRNNQLQETSDGIIDKLRSKLESISIDQTTLEALNQQISKHLIEKAELEAKLEVSDIKLADTEKQINHLKVQIEDYRKQLDSKSEELLKAQAIPREDPNVHCELGFLQARTAQLSKDLIEAKKAEEIAQEQLAIQAEKSQSNLQQIQELQSHLEEEKSKYERLVREKEACNRAFEVELNQQRIRIEKDAAENFFIQDTKHKQALLILQKSEADAKARCDVAQAELQMERERVVTDAATIEELKKQLDTAGNMDNIPNVEHFETCLRSLEDRCNSGSIQVQTSGDDTTRLRKLIQERDASIAEISAVVTSIRREWMDSFEKIENIEARQSSEINQLQNKITSMERRVKAADNLREAVGQYLRRKSQVIEGSGVDGWAPSVLYEPVQDNQPRAPPATAESTADGPLEEQSDLFESVIDSQSFQVDKSLSAPDDTRQIDGTPDAGSILLGLKKVDNLMAPKRPFTPPYPTAATIEKQSWSKDAPNKSTRKVAQRQPRRRAQSVTSSDSMVYERTQVTTEYSIRDSSAAAGTPSSYRLMNTSERFIVTPRSRLRRENKIFDAVSPTNDISSAARFRREHPIEDHAELHIRRRTDNETEGSPHPKRIKKAAASKMVFSIAVPTEKTQNRHKKPTKGILKRKETIPNTLSKGPQLYEQSETDQATSAIIDKSEVSSTNHLKRPTETTRMFEKSQYNRVASSKFTHLGIIESDSGHPHQQNFQNLNHLGAGGSALLHPRIIPGDGETTQSRQLQSKPSRLSLLSYNSHDVIPDSMSSQLLE